MGKTTARACAYSITAISSAGLCFIPSGSLAPMWVWASNSSSGPWVARMASHQGRSVASMSTMERGTLQTRTQGSDTEDMHFRRERVRVETARHEIEGTLLLPNEGFRSRITDFLNAQRSDFLPLTDVEVTWLDGSLGAEPAHLFCRCRSPQRAG